MNKKTGKMKSKSRSQWPERNWNATNPELPENNFRLITPSAIRERSKLSISPNMEPNHGELLADAKYHLYDNKSKREEFLDGGLLLCYFRYEYKTTFIPWVLARCTIIPR